MKEIGHRVRGPVPFSHPFSMGIVTWDGRETGQTLVRRADKATYAAKATNGIQSARADSPAPDPPLRAAAGLDIGSSSC